MTWARLSDDLVVATMMILALAFCLYAVSMAQRTTRQRGVAKEPVTTPVAASSAAGDALEHPPEVGAPWSERTARIASVMVVMGLVLNAAAVLARGIAAERSPWGNMYEFAIVGSTAILGAYVAGLSRYPLHRLGIWVIGLVLVTLGSAVTVLYTPVDALIPVLDSYWLAIHVGAAIVSGGAFTVAAVTSAVQLFRPGRHPERDEMLERVSYGLIVFAFPVWTFAVIAGAVWAEAAWGRYWGWDPKETWAFITWVFYAAYLHAQSTAGWKGKRAAWFSIAGYIAFLFNFIGVNMWVGGLHSYAGV